MKDYFKIAICWVAVISSLTTAAQQPTLQASNLVITSPAAGSIMVTWVNGNGTGRMVTICQCTNNPNVPFDFQNYNPNSNYVGAFDVGNSQVVYRQSSVVPSVVITGISSSITYSVRVYEYNGSDFSPDFLTTTSIDNPKDFSSQPSAQAFSITFSGVQASSVTLNWNSGDGQRRLVLAREGSAVSSLPSDGSTYAADAVFGNGQNLGGQNYAVYDGIGNSAVITNLSSNTTYHFRIFEYNLFGTPDYLTVTAPNNPNSVTTTAAGNTSTLQFPGGIGAIPSTTTTQGSAPVVFTFQVKDMGDDGQPTRIQSMTFNLAPGVLISDWSQVLAGAELRDNFSNTLTMVPAAAVTLAFTGITASGAQSSSSLGNVGDNDTKTYSLKVWFKTGLIPPISTTLDHDRLLLTLTSTSIVTDPSRSGMAPGQTVNSGPANGLITVSATKLRFLQQPSNVYPNASMSPLPTLEATDVNNVRDLDFIGAVSVTSSGTMTAHPSLPMAGGFITLNPIHTASATGRALTSTNSSGLTNATSTTFNVLAPSNASDITTSTFPTNILYANFQESTNIQISGTSIEVAQFTIRDGAGVSDADPLSTNLTSLAFSLVNPGFIRRAALYDGSTELAEATPSGSTLTFSGITATAPDNSSKTLSLRASFTTSVSDNAQFSFAVTSATAQSGFSTFATANAGGAVTSTTGDNNRIEVVATKLDFTTQPPAVIRPNIDVAPRPIVEARDGNNIRDVDNTSAIAINNNQSLSMINLPGALVGGTVTFPLNFRYTAFNTVNPNGTLTAAFAGLTSGVSSPVFVDGASPSVVLSDNHADNIVRDADNVTITATFTESDQISEAPGPAITLSGASGVTNIGMTKTSNLVWTYVWNVPTGNFSSTATITATDRAGNSNSAATGKILYTIDNTSPLVAITTNHPDNTVKDADNVLITATFTDVNGVDEVTPPAITISGTSVTNVPMLKTNNLVWTYSWDVPPGNFTPVFSIAAKDVAGNSAAAATGVTSLVVDNRVPNATPAGSYSSTQFTANWDIITGATYLVTVSSDNFSSTLPGFSDAPATSNSIVVSGLTAGGTYQYKVKFVIGTHTSDESNIITAVTVPPPPVATTATLPTSQTSFTANWNPAQSATEYFVDVATDAGFTNIVVGYGNAEVIGATSLIVNNLAAGTTYYYQVKARNNYSTVTSGPSNPVTAVTLPNVPTGLLAEQISSDGFLATWNAAPGAAGYKLDVSKDNFATMAPGYDGKDVSGVSEEFVVGLLSSTLYRFRVRAYNNGGETASSVFKSVKTSGSTTDTSPKIISVTSPGEFNNAGQEKISIIVSGGDGEKTLRFFRRAISSAQFISSVTTSVTQTSLDIAIESNWLDNMGMEFYFRFEDELGQSAESARKFIYRSFNQEPVSNLGMGGAIDSYRIFSIPVKLEDNSIQEVFKSVESQYGGYDKTKWRLVHYEGGKNIDYTEGLNKIDQGKGYWFNSKDNVSVKISGSVIPVDQANPFKLNLDKGWTQIGNPYPFDISWVDVLAVNNNPAGVGKLFTYDPASVSFKESGGLKAWEGGFVKADNATTINIPVTVKQSASGRVKGYPEIESRDLSSDEWFLPLTLQTGKAYNKMGGIGMHQDARPGNDRYDEQTLPRFVKYLELNSYHHDHFLPRFTRDVVPSALNHNWDFVVESNFDRGEAALSWDDKSLGESEAQLMLYDVDANVLLDMKANNEYRFELTEKRHLKIFFSADGQSLLPDITGTGRPYPNPSISSITIPFIVGVNHQEIKIVMFDMMGKQVKVVANEHFKPGKYEVTWDGNDEQGNRVAQGIYIYQLTSATTRAQQGRLVLK